MNLLIIGGDERSIALKDILKKIILMFIHHF